VRLYLQPVKVRPNKTRNFKKIHIWFSISWEIVSEILFTSISTGIFSYIMV